MIEAKRDVNVELAQMLNEIGLAVSNELKTSDVKWISAFIDWTNGIVERLSKPTRKKLKVSFFKCVKCCLIAFLLSSQKYIAIILVILLNFSLEKKVDLSSETDATAIRFIEKSISFCINNKIRFIAYLSRSVKRSNASNNYLIYKFSTS